LVFKYASVVHSKKFAVFISLINVDASLWQGATLAFNPAKVAAALRLQQTS
jgi:hypothetical protein